MDSIKISWIMKNNIQKFILVNTLIFISSLGSLLVAQKQVEIPIAKFLMTISITDDVATINCLSGCKYDKLSIRFEGDEPQAINNKGTTTLLNDFAVVTAEAYTEGYFLFTIQKTRDGVELKSYHGINWDTLNFEQVPDVSQGFNQDGKAY